MNINILGTEYSIKKTIRDKDEYMKKNGLLGYCCGVEKSIVILDMFEDNYYKDESYTFKKRLTNETMRHEVIHAFLNESGLKWSSLNCKDGWANNEEMIDWIAIQFPKILKVYKELKCI